MMHHHDTADDDAALEQVEVVARQICPGDHLPPQRALHGTLFQRDGFTVGPDDRDVADLAVLPGRVLLFGPAGTLDSIPVDARVCVLRRRREAPDRKAV